MSHMHDKPLAKIGVPAIGLAAFLLALIMGCSRPSKPVLKVEDSWVSQEQWQSFMKASNLAPTAPMPEKEKALKSLTKRSVAVALALKKGLDKQAGFDEKRPVIKEQVMVYTLYQDRVDKLPPIGEKEAKAYFKENNAKRRLRHILCATEAEAKGVAEGLKAGKPFKDLLASHTLDKKSIAEDGDLGWFKKAEVPQNLQDPIFKAAVGSIIGPSQTSGGWEVILVAETQEADEAAYAIQAEAVMASMKRERADKVRRELIDECQKKYNLKIRQDTLPTDLNLQVLPADSQTVVADVGPIKISMKELKEFIRSYSSKTGAPPPKQKADFAKYLELLSGEKAVLAMATEQGLAKRKDVQSQIWNIEQNDLADLFSQSYIKEAPVTKEQLEAFYQANLEGFKDFNELTVRYIEAASVDDLRSAVDAMRAGAKMADVQKKYGIRLINNGKAVPFDFKAPPKGMPPQAIRALAGAPVDSWVAAGKTETGVQAMQVVSTREGKQLSKEELGERLRQAYLSKNGTQILDAYLGGEAQKGLKVETFPKNL